MKKNEPLGGLVWPSLKKILLIMRIAFILLLVGILQTTANNAYSQKTKLSMDFSNAELVNILDRIETQTDFFFLYNEKLIDTNRKVTINVKDQGIEDVLKSLFAGTDVRYSIIDRKIILSPADNVSSTQQQKSVSGKVTDSAGGPLPGVSVVVKGTTNGTITDMNGNYTLGNVQSKSILQYSFVGMKTEEVAVEAKSVINITLTEEAIGIEEVVAVGYGVQRKESVTGSVASLGGDKLRDVPAANITQTLQGRVAGVDMAQTSSKPGATMQIRIRGTRSLNASNDPLIVLDGIPFAGSISDISSDDIKSIDILKDASATAIYGSRGANGVILITTNKGKKNQKAQVAYNGYYGAKNAIKYPMMNSTQFVALRKAANMYANGTDESDDVNIDWQDLFYRTGVVTNHDVVVSGGNEKGNYKFGAGYYKDEAVIPDQEYTRYNFRGSLDQEIGGLLRFGFTSNNSYSVTDGNNLGMYGVLSMSPIANPYNADGTWKRTVKMPLDESWVYSKDIINNLGDKYKDETKAFGSYNTLYGELKIPGVEGLKARVNLGGNFRMSNYGNYTGQGVFATTATTPSNATVRNSLTTNWAIENLLTYDRTFAQKHQVNAVVLYSAEQTRANSSQVSAKNITSDMFQYYNLGQTSGDPNDITINPGYQGYEVSGLMSWMGRVMYSFDDRYMLSMTYRSDASSRLAEGHKWHSYPAISAGWNIKKESFMQNIPVIDALKLRAGYGQTSNQSVNPYATLGLLSTRPYNFGSTNAVGYYVSQLPNANLGWEYSITKNVGLDFSLLKSRLSGTVEYYITNTKDILLSVGLPSTSGVSSYMANVGETQNKGLEFSLNGVILDNVNGWTWEAGINLYRNRNKLVALSSGQTRDESNWWFVGHSLNVVYDYKKIGLWQAEDQNLQQFEKGGNVGMIKVLYTGDYNADGTPVRAIGAADRQIIDLDPDFQGGFNTRVAYKGFDLSVVGSFQAGGTLISTLYGASGYLNLLSGRRGNINVDYWTTENTGAKYPKPGGLASGDNPKYGTTLSYFDASYLKIRTISLGYNFTQKFIKNAGLDKLRVYCTVQNPLVLFSPYHKESGMDPETNSYGNENQAVNSYQTRLLTIGYNTPSTHNYMIGINIIF